MTKLIDDAGSVFTEEKNINEIMEELNKDNGDWSYYYRPGCSVVNAYFCERGESGKSDYDGENAVETYDVIED